MGNQQFQPILVLIIFLVSLLSSVDVIRGSGRTNFLKYSREQTVETAALESPPPPAAPAQPLFYQQSKKDNNPHGLNAAPPPHTPPPSPPPPPTYTHNTPPPHHHGFGFPNNYDPNYYVTHADNTAEKPTIIEDEKKELQANKYDTTNFLDEEEDEDEDKDEMFEDSFNLKAPEPPHGPASHYVYDRTFTTTKTDNYKTKYAPTHVGLLPQGMSDTRVMENGKYFFNTKAGEFTSTEHPNNRFTTTTPTDIDPLLAEEDEEFNTQQP